MSTSRMVQRIASLFALSLICCVLSGCGSLSGLWTGASLLYDRHSWFKKIDDFQLRADVARAIYHNKLFKHSMHTVDVAVFNGDLLLAGHVETAELRTALYSHLLAAQLNYRRLFRYVTVASSESNRVLDSWITTQIVTQVLLDTTVDPHAYKVVTVDQVVYLMGDMLPEQALKLIDVARNTDHVRYVVKLLRYYHLTDTI